MLKSRLFVSAAVLLSCLAGCKNAVDVPSPADEPGFPPPISQPLTFSPEIKLHWQESAVLVKPSAKKFDLRKLPLKVFDGTGFKPFLKSPAEVTFAWDKLPVTTFNYETLPSGPLEFKDSILPPPQIIRSVHPHIKLGSADFIYEFEEPFFSSFVYDVFEDKAGFVWISAENGLYRYDGDNLLQYKPGSVKTDFSCILEDDQGRIWLTTLGNELVVMDLRSGTYSHIDLPGKPNDNNFKKMFLDRQGRIWISRVSQIDQYPIVIIDEKAHLIKQLSWPGKKANEFSMTEDTAGNVWVPTIGDGLKIINVNTGTIKHLQKQNGLSNDTVLAITRDSVNRFFVSALGNELNMIDPVRKTIRYYNQRQGLEQKAGFLIPNLISKNGKIWVGTYENQTISGGIGLEIIDPDRGSFRKINTTVGLSGDQIFTLFADRNGQIWVGTRTGLDVIGRNGDNFRRIGNENISTLGEDSRGNIWVGSLHSGIEILDMATGLARSLNRGNGLGGDTMHNLDIFHGGVYIQSDGGLDIIDSAFTTITHWGKQQGFPDEGGLNGALRDKEGFLWVTGDESAGLVKLDPQKQKLYRLERGQGVRDNSSYYCLQDQDGKIWLSSYNGPIGVIDPQRNTLKYLENTPAAAPALSKYLLPDDSGNMWVGCGSTLYVVNRARDSITTISKREGFKGDQIISLNQYGGRIYVGTLQDGISILTPLASPGQKTWEIVALGREQGIIETANTQRSDIVTKDGRFLWGDEGITVLQHTPSDGPGPKTLVCEMDLWTSALYFTNNPASAKGAEKHIKWDSVSGVFNMPVNLRLPYDHNSLQFHFLQSDAGVNNGSSYRYFLQGVDQKWSDPTSDTRSENYLNLPPGDYTFKVVSLYNGKWTHPGSFGFSILPPWWLTWWAYTLYVIGFCALVWGIARYRSRWLQKENVRLEAIVEQRTKELSESFEHLKATQSQLIQSEKMASLGELTAGIAHEIQNPLNFVNNFSEVNRELIGEMEQAIDTGDFPEVKALARDIRDNEEKITHHGKRADAIVKGMLQHSRTSTGQKEPTDLNALADEYLRLAYHGLRAKDKSFNATVKTNYDPAVGNIVIVPQDVGRVILNLVTNAFYAVSEKKNASADGYEPTVSLTTRRLGDRVELEVRDNGNGIPPKVIDKIFQPFFTTKPAGQGTGLGLSLSYDIVRAHGGEITVDTREGEGTEFLIRLPNYA